MKKKKPPTMQSTLQQAYRPLRTQADAAYVLNVEVCAMVAWGGPISCLLDPLVRVALILHYPIIRKFLPLTIGTIYDKYVMEINKATTEELKTFVMKIPGLINISMDGVTVNRKQK
eukprot:12891171-Ditylum_brightwellii.AAC.1